MAEQHNYVTFYLGTQLEYDGLGIRDEFAFYVIRDSKRIYLGDVLLSNSDVIEVSYDVRADVDPDPMGIASVYALKGTSVIVTPIVPTSSQHTFACWKDAETHLTYLPGEAARFTQDTVLEAVWVSRWATVSYSFADPGPQWFVNEGDWHTQYRDNEVPIILNSGIPVLEASVAQSSAPMMFMGWYVDDTCAYYPNRYWNEEYNIRRGNIYAGHDDITLSAKMGRRYTVTFTVTIDAATYSTEYPIAYQMMYAAAIDNLEDPAGIGSASITSWTITSGSAAGQVITLEDLQTGQFNFAENITLEPETGGNN